MLIYMLTRRPVLTRIPEVARSLSKRSIGLLNWQSVIKAATFQQPSPLTPVRTASTLESVLTIPIRKPQLFSKLPIMEQSSSVVRKCGQVGNRILLIPAGLFIRGRISGEFVDRLLAGQYYPKSSRGREMVIVNGHILISVLSQDRMTEGSFFVDEAAGRAIIWPPAGTDISTATIEVPVLPKLFESHHVSSLTIQGIVFEHSNACVSMNPSAAVAIIGGANVSIEDCTFGWNNWTGLRFGRITDSSIRRITASYKEPWVSWVPAKAVFAEDVENSHSNWRGALGEFYEFEPAGGNFLHVHGGVFKNFRSVGNQASGHGSTQIIATSQSIRLFWRTIACGGS